MTLFEASLGGRQLRFGLNQRHLQAFEDTVVVDRDPAADEGEYDEYGQKQAGDHGYLMLGEFALGRHRVECRSPIARTFNSRMVLLS